MHACNGRYEAKLAKIRKTNRTSITDVSDAGGGSPPVPPLGNGNGRSHRESFKNGGPGEVVEPGGDYTFNYEELKKPAKELPAGVDPSKREQYLSDAEFLQVLGSPRGDFEKLKGWKQNQLKKAAGLF